MRPRSCCAELLPSMAASLNSRDRRAGACCFVRVGGRFVHGTRGCPCYHAESPLCCQQPRRSCCCSRAFISRPRQLRSRSYTHSGHNRIPPKTRPKTDFVFLNAPSTTSWYGMGFVSTDETRKSMLPLRQPPRLLPRPRRLPQLLLRLPRPPQHRPRRHPSLRPLQVSVDT